MLKRRTKVSRGWAHHNDTAGPVHIWPLGDLMTHDIEGDCICGPEVEWFHPETGEAHEQPLVSHHSLDGREAQERG